VMKNLVMYRVKGVGLVDDEVMALANQFLLSEGDVGRNHTVSMAQKQKEIYPSVDIATLATVAVESALGSYGCYGILHSKGEIISVEGTSRVVGGSGCFD
jgi:molybdopterin/thiamine biosynthesis adenylyltransferase